MTASTDQTSTPTKAATRRRAKASEETSADAPSPEVQDPSEQAPETPEPAAGAPATTEPVDPDEDVDLAAILPSADTLTVGGIPCEVRRIKMRELMLLAQIISAGPGMALARVDWSEATQDQVMAMALIALPEAEAEVFNFLRAVVAPREKAKANELQPHLDNPDPSDFLAIVGVLIAQERDEFERLGKELRVLVKGVGALFRTGQRRT